MSVHYKFKSALDYDTVTFDGLHISVGDLKAAISQQKRIGKTSDFDLQITNAQTKEVYTDDTTLIPKNTSLLVARIPLSQQPKKQWEGLNNASVVPKDVTVNKGLADLSRMEGSEQDKINAMISQSTFDYDPSNYQKIRGQNQRGIVPSYYICYKCQKHGHWIKDCPLANSQSGESVEIRRSTGIPRSFMVPVDGPKAPGAMMTPGGTFAVPVVDHEAYLASESGGGGEGADAPAATAAPAASEPAIPDELICSLCRDLLTDAVMIPCCGNSFCDECIRGALLESEDHECPDCREKEISPTTLIPNRFLRNSVSSFRNQTGYSRRTPHRPAVLPQPKPAPERQPVITPAIAPNGQPSVPVASSGVCRAGPGPGDESDGSQDDNITVTVPARARRPPHHPRRDYGPPPTGKPPMDPPQTNPQRIRRDEQKRANTPTVDERRDSMLSQPYNRGGPPSYAPPQGGPPPQRFNPGYGRPPVGARYNAYPVEPYQPPPPGIKDSPTERRDEDPLEAFNRMIREKEARAKRREEERRRLHSPSPRVRPRSPRSPRPPRPRTRSRSPPPPPRSRSHSRSPPPPSRASPPRAPSRVRYSRSRSVSRGRRRSPWSPRRRRTRERTLSLTRSPSPRRRHRSPLRYRSPLRSPGPRSPPPRSPPPRSPPPPRGSPHSLARSPLRSPHRPPGLRSPRGAISPQRFVGVYDELLSPSRRSVEPLYGPRFGPRSHGPPPPYPPIGIKPIAPLATLPVHQEPAGYRGRYDGPPFDEVPPGVDTPIPGYEPSPFDKPPIGPPATSDRDRLLPMNYRETYRPQPYVDGPATSFRDLVTGQKDIPIQLSEPPRFREPYRGAPPFREQVPIPYRDGQPFREPSLQQSYRDPNFRAGPPPGYRDNNYRNSSHVPYRDSGPTFRDNPLHNFREGPGPFRPPNDEPRETLPPNYHDPSFREGYRDIPIQEHIRSTVRPNNRSRAGPRRNPILDHERHRENLRNERDIRDRERYNENREPSDKNHMDKKTPHERSRDERPRDYDKARDHNEKERERDHEKNTPEKKLKTSPKRGRGGESRDKKRSESRGRSREKDKRDKKEERTREKSSMERSKEHKEKDRKLKERDKKKKKREKEAEKKKKRERKDKKEKGTPKKPEENVKIDNKEETEKIEKPSTFTAKQEPEISAMPIKDLNENKLYEGDAVGEIDKKITKNYVKKEKDISDKQVEEAANKEENNFDGIELQVSAEELDLKVENENNEKEMLAPLPELSKWEVDDDNVPGDKMKEPGEITSPDEEEDNSKITSEVIKRAENAIFAKTITSLRPIEIKKISNDRAKLYTDESKVNSKTMNNIQVTVPVSDIDHRSVEVNEKKNRHSKTPPRLSVKERLGGKVDDLRRPREDRIVQSAVALVKSRSKTPKREQPYRRVTVDRDRGRRLHNKSEEVSRYTSSKSNAKGSTVEAMTEKEVKHIKKMDKKGKCVIDNTKSKDSDAKNPEKEAHAVAERERKRSTLDEAHFEPDYDENVESDNETKEETNIKKRERSKSPEDSTFTKKPKTEDETIKLDLTNVKKKPETASESSSDTESSSSSSSEEVRKRKRKRKRTKRKKKRMVSDSESDSESSSDDHKKKKKKRKHKKKSSKKKKKSKHK